jgi:putative transposase
LCQEKEMGYAIESSHPIPRTRTFSPVALLKSYARRLFPVERLIMLAFILGLSTRKVARALLPILGQPISASTVSRIAPRLDAAVQAYHRRKLPDHYQVLILDGLVVKRKTGVGAQKRTVLVALGIRSDGQKEVIDFYQAPSEKKSHWMCAGRKLGFPQEKESQESRGRGEGQH